MQRESTVTQMGMDSHRKFSRVTARDAKGEIVRRQRLEHGDRRQLRARLATWPYGDTDSVGRDVRLGVAER